MSPSTKIANSRLLYADFISDENEEKEIIKKINGFGFTVLAQEDNTPTKFSVGDIGNFVGQLRSMCKPDPELLDYISNLVFWIHRDGILPLKVAIIEVILKTDDLQQMKKTDLESKIWKLSLLLGRCFCEGPIPLSNSSKDFRILKFSSRAIPNVALRNFVAEFVVEAERGYFDDFNKKLDSLGEAVGTKKMITQKIREAVGDKSDITKKIEKIAMKGDTPAVQKVKDVRKEIIALEPISFLEGGFSYDQSIVRGYANEMFIIGKIVQGSLNNSTPLYFTKLSLGISEIPLANLESMPVLQFPGRYPLLDFSFGAGQILALQLLNSWNRNVEMLIGKVTTKQTTTPMNIKKETEETLEELRDLLFHRSIDQKISVNYRRELLDLANPSAKTFLYELPIPPEEDTLYSSDPERHGLEKPGPMVSNLGALVLNNLELNENHLSDLIALKRSKIDILKIAEDRKNNRIMLCLTAIVALATIVNVILFVINRI